LIDHHRIGELKKKLLWLLALLIVCAVFVFVKWNSFGRLSKFDVGVAGDGGLDAALERIRDDHGLPALAAVLVHNGEIVETGAVGVRAVGSPEPVTTADRWHLGSIGKSMTATLVAVLVEKGVIDWDTTIRDVFPELVEGIRPEYADVRLEEFLSHTSGLPYDAGQVPSFSTFQSNTKPMREQRHLWAAELLALSPEKSRGTHLYANGNYIVVGAMLEAVTGELWEDLMVQQIFTPLNMTSTGFGAPGTVGDTPDQPRGHIRKQGELRPLQPDRRAGNPAAIGPAGTVHTSLADAAIYMSAHLAGLQGHGGFISAESFGKLHTQAPGTKYALGWNIRTHSHAGGHVLYHHGTNGVWHATMWIAPNRDYAILTVTNSGDALAVQGNDAAIQAMIDRCNAAFD
jgi:CubicO group peptidase (beta-lactamase class C family)